MYAIPVVKARLVDMGIISLQVDLRDRENIVD
jgi:hypothetical protein